MMGGYGVGSVYYTEKQTPAPTPAPTSAPTPAPTPTTSACQSTQTWTDPQLYTINNAYYGAMYKSDSGQLPANTNALNGEDYTEDTGTTYDIEGWHHHNTYGWRFHVSASQGQVDYCKQKCGQMAEDGLCVGFYTINYIQSGGVWCMPVKNVPAASSSSSSLCSHACSGFWSVTTTNCPEASSGGSGSAAKGDPHLMNMKGEAFDVMQTGNMMLLEIPRGSSPATLDLALHAEIEHLGIVDCGPTFITSASITGRWIGVPVEIRSGPLVQKATPSKHSFAIRLDGKNWLAHAEMQGTTELSKGASITAQERMFLFQVRGLDIAVSQPKRPRTFLDIQVKGLGNLKTEIGGLLGIDDHSAVEEVPSGCKMSASSLSLRSAPIEDHEALQWSARALL
jgi:hypothetical protein